MKNPPPPTVLIATSNPGKQREFSQLLPPGVRIRDCNQIEIRFPEEAGNTFAENARAKAAAAAAQSGLLTLADDSGLIVDHLDGLPGVRSARFGGEPPSDRRNREALLAALAGIAPPDRGARFVCAIVLARPGRIIAEVEGTCEGSIATSAIGDQGFGYDPLFLLPDGRTMAQLLPIEKNQRSHRATAYRRLLPSLLRELNAEPIPEKGH